MRPEKHFGVVTDNADPDKLGALKVEVKTLVDGTPLKDDWIPGKFPFAGKGEGFYYTPEVGALVEVDVEADPERAAEELDARWSSARFTRGDPIPTEFQSDPTKRGGIKWGEEVLLQDKAKALTALISGKVRLGDEDCAHPLVRGDVLNNNLNTYLTTLTGALAVWQALPPGVPATTDLLIVFANVLKPVVDALIVAQNSWLSTKCKTE